LSSATTIAVVALWVPAGASPLPLSLTLHSFSFGK
jgi:hypothetical protein